MQITIIKKRTPALIAQLLEIWEASVRATHLFLSEEAIRQIKTYVPQGLKEIPHLLIAKTDGRHPVAFMGIEAQKLEMLFVAPAARGKGVGKMLLQYAIKNYDVQTLAVNEQNPQAKGFYEHMGFSVWKRSELDEQGNPYPILYMKLG